MNALNRIVTDEGWQMPRRFALALAMLFLVVYIAALVAGSALQSALRLPLSMGWFQQIAATATAVLFAFALREPRAQLGLKDRKIKISRMGERFSRKVTRVLHPCPAPHGWERKTLLKLEKGWEGKCRIYGVNADSSSLWKVIRFRR